MDGLYVPPDGAMQFIADTHPVPAFRNAQLWVRPITTPPSRAVRDRIGCDCKVFYEIVNCDPAPLWDGSWTVVCKHIGRVIE